MDDDETFEAAVRVALATPWAVREEVLLQISGMILRRLRSAPVDTGALKPAAAARAGRATAGSVAIIPLKGVVMPRGGQMTEMFGGAPLSLFRARFRDAMADDDVGAIVLDIASPGGMVTGVPETAAEIAAARGKQIVAVASEQAASAAYWIATAAAELVVSPSAEVGSIGVWTMHVDYSKALENDGVKVTLISAGKYKTEGHPFGPLSDEAKASLQESVNETHTDFIKAVAAGRKTSQASVREGFGEGRSVGARAAIKLGMADSVETLDQVVTRLRGKPSAAPPPAARAVLSPRSMVFRSL